MVSCGSQIIKIILGIINLVFMVLGGGIIFVGYKLVKWDEVTKGVTDLAHFNFKAVSFIILAIGVVIALIAIFGFFGACCENSFMLNTYGFLIILLIAAQIYAIVYAVTKKGDIEGSLKQGIKDAIAEIGKNKDTALILQEVQYSLKCCGWDGKDDYNGTRCLSSCCGTKPNSDNPYDNDCEKSKVTFPGCSQKLKLDEVTHYLGSVMGVCIAIILTELILVFAACCLAREVRR